MGLHNSIYFMVFSIAKLYEVQFLQQEIFDY